MLFLCHRIPFPPNKGDKIRSYHLLRYLSAHYRVYLGAFVDDPQDWVYADKLEELCEEVCLLKLDPTLARIKSLWALCSGQALSLPYYSNGKMTRWVNKLQAEKGIDRVVVYSAVMAQYVSGAKYSTCKKIADMVDVDSEKWREYSQQKSFPMSWVYHREAKCLLKYERHVAASFNYSLFVSIAEAEKFKELAPDVATHVGSYSNGVDTKYFCPQRDYPSPFKDNESALVFTGAMDYWPNIDAVKWFAREVFPAIIANNTGARFYIVGSNPAPQVLKLAELSGVVVTGRVDDVRPYLAHAAAAIAPMRIARGIQNKVLEAMAMARPVIVSEAGIEGIKARHGEDVLVARQTSDYSRYIDDVIAGGCVTLGSSARRRVVQDFSWENNLPLVGQLLEQQSA
ncbi:MAG: TIGR03087 family PEP-CTERM/XrtA system glycosyltransferase [Gammaproteobacteria bacterium]|nr:TIGR03087 family PEP-CTERM/XrtA system glycosyltransferase [Gammaproteobacteria bacterium]MBQ0840791.1 TIGR03087 family PEP-CTERM/XrtA system glycosyltransferase [Gammaproteobacteria bacterium]